MMIIYLGRKGVIAISYDVLQLLLTAEKVPIFASEAACESSVFWRKTADDEI